MPYIEGQKILRRQAAAGDSSSSVGGTVTYPFTISVAANNLMLSENHNPIDIEGEGRLVIVGDTYNSTGNVHIYDVKTGTPNRLTSVKGSDSVVGDQIGRSVAFTGTGYFVAGAPGADIGANTGQGAAYVFTLRGDQVAKLTAPDGAANDQFGGKVAAGNGLIAVAAPTHDPTGGSASVGSVYLYDVKGNFIRKINPLTALPYNNNAVGDFKPYWSNGDAEFGWGMAFSRDSLYISAPYTDKPPSTTLERCGSLWRFDLSGNYTGQMIYGDNNGDFLGGNSGYYRRLAARNGVVVISPDHNTQSNDMYLKVMSPALSVINTVTPSDMGWDLIDGDGNYQTTTAQFVGIHGNYIWATAPYLDIDSASVTLAGVVSQLQFDGTHYANYTAASWFSSPGLEGDSGRLGFKVAFADNDIWVAYYKYDGTGYYKFIRAAMRDNNDPFEYFDNGPDGIAN